MAKRSYKLKTDPGEIIMQVAPAIFWRGNRITHRSFLPYATAIGQMTLAWNAMQERLRELYNALVVKEATGDVGMSSSLWHAVDNDRSQRSMLEAAAKRLAWRNRLSTEACDEIQWLVGKANNLADTRNDVIHSPLRSKTNAEQPPITLVEAIASTGHKRAKKLSSKPDLLGEIRWCRDTALTFAAYAFWLRSAVLQPQGTWPERPKLPTRKPKTQRRPRKASAQNKRPPLRQKSSPA